MTPKYTLTEAEQALLDSLLTDVRPVLAKKRAPAHKASIVKKSPPKIDLSTPTTLDLHGLTLVLAHQKLSHFITEHYHAGNRNLLIITGKSGELARNVPRWLTLTDLASMVSSVNPAPPRKGGTGALVVKLKKHD